MSKFFYIFNKYLYTESVRHSRNPLLIIYRIGLNFVMPSGWRLFYQLNPPYPETVFIDPSSVCNLHCPLCPTGTGTIKLKKGIMNFTDFKFYLDKLPFARSLVLYNWGEPFLNPQIFEIIKYAKSKKINIMVDSNFSLEFTEADFFKIVNSGLNSLRISLDGASPETYEMYRKGGDFNLVYNNLKRLREIQKQISSSTPQIIWKFLVNKYNQQEIEKAKKLAEDIDVKIIFEKMGLTDDILDVDIVPGETLATRINYWLPSAKNYIMDRYQSENKQLADSRETKCPMLFGNIIIHSDGHVLPCCYVANEQSSLGNLREQSLKEIWSSDKYLYARSLFLPDAKIKRVPVVCEHCNIYKRCHGA